MNALFASTPSDFVVIKTNCEGSEVDIIDSFLKGNTFNYFYTLLITFDIRDYPSMAYKELEIRRRLKASGYINFCFSDDMMIGPTHEKRIENWLTSFGVDLPSVSVEDLKNLDLFEDIENIITLIEWPQIIENKPKNLIELKFEYAKDHKKRLLQMKGLTL